MKVRSLAHPDESLADGLSAGGWLHFDVSMGCAGDMLIAALVDLGVAERVLREALHDAGLSQIGPIVEPGARGGVRGLQLTFVSDLGPLEPSPSPRTARARPAQLRRRRRAPRRTHRRPDPALEIEQAQPAPDDDETEPADPTPRPARNRVTAWLEGERMTAAELLAFLEAARLSPMTQVLARKAARRMFEALTSVRGVGLDEIHFSGPVGLDVLCDLICFSAAVSELSPDKITASPLALSSAPVREGHAVGDEVGAVQPGPSPWTLAILQDMPVIERALSFPPTTPTGAALIWAVAHTSDPRGPHLVGRAGHGLGARLVPGYANVSRVFHGPPGRDVAIAPPGEESSR